MSTLPSLPPPLTLVLEFLRVQQGDDPFGFQFIAQDYLLRTPGGGYERAPLAWNEALLAELAEVRRPGCDPAIRQRLGELLRQFVMPFGWAEHSAQIVEATRNGRRVYVTLRSAAAELYALPWELLTIKATGQHLGELNGVLLRYEWPETTTVPEQALPRKGCGRILLAWSAAAGAVPAAEHVHAIGEACRAGLLPFDPERDVLAHASLQRLSVALAAAKRDQQPIAVLHLLAHGGSVGSTFGLVLSGESGSEDVVVVDAGRLRQLLGPYTDMVRLVVLMACDSGNVGALGNQLGSVAQTLHRAGIAAVVASRSPLSVRGSVQLAQSLYSGLVTGNDCLESSLLRARESLAQDATAQDWASLQLYARVADGSDTRPLVLGTRRLLGLNLWRSHRMARAALLLLLVALLGGAAVVWPPLDLPPANESPPGVIVVAPWLAWLSGRDPGAELCHELERLDAKAVRCVRTSLLATQNRVRRMSRDAGAVVLAEVTGQAVSLVSLSGDEDLLLPPSALPKAPLTTVEAARTVAGLADALRRLLSEEHPRCEVDLSGAAQLGSETELLAVLLDWHCQGGQPGGGAGRSQAYSALLAGLETQVCQHSSARDRACGLVRYLAALDCPAEASAACRPALNRLRELFREAVDLRLRHKAGLELARRGCRVAPDEAGMVLLELQAEMADPCERLLLLPMVACVLESSSLLTERRTRLATMDHDLLPEADSCPQVLRAAVLAERGAGYLDARAWEAARESFAQAHELSPESLSMLGQAEALLMAGRTGEVAQTLVLSQVTQPPLRTHGAFLLWLASRREEDAWSLLSEYEALPGREIGTSDSGGTLKQVACATAQGCRAYAILVAPKAEQSARALRAALVPERTEHQ